MTRSSDPDKHQTSPHGRLPAYLDRFIGRELDLERLASQLLEGPEKLLTLTGTGGIGKTRLAVTLARQVQREFDQGVLFFDLSNVKDVNLLEGVLTTKLTAALGRTGEGALLENLLVDCALLLLLDNLEQIEGVGDFLTALLERLPLLRVLATSRSPLQVRGERRYRVQPLALTADGEPSEAARLLLERARAVNSYFAADQQDFAQLEEVCQRLDGLPLALELVATRADLLSSEQMLFQLERGLLPKRPGHQDRHGSLSLAIGWSYNLLGPDEQRLFRQLGVFKGSFCVQSVSSITGIGIQDSDLLEMLTNLAERNLITVEKGQRLRFKLLHTLRQFALEQLKTGGEYNELRQRHALFYTEEARHWYAQWYSAQQLEALQNVTEDQDQLEFALEWCLQHCALELYLEPAMDLAGFLHGFYTYLGHAQKMYTQARTLYQALPEQHLSQRGRALEAQAQGASRLGRLVEAQSLLEQAGDLARQSEQTDVLAGILHTLARIHLSRDEHGTALPLLEEAVNAWRTVSGDSDLTNTLHSLGLLHFYMHHLAKARPVLLEVLRLEQAQENVLGEMMALCSVGNLEAAHERWTLAEQHLRAALTRVRAVSLSGPSHHVIVGLADVLTALGEATEARTLLEEVQPYYQSRMDTPLGVRYALTQTRLSLVQEDFATGISWLDRAFQVVLLGPFGFPFAAVCHLYARWHHGAGQPLWAQAWLVAGDQALRLRPAQPHALQKQERAALEAEEVYPSLESASEVISHFIAQSPFSDEASLKEEVRKLQREAKLIAAAFLSSLTLFPAPVSLSAQESRVLFLLAKGRTNKQIASLLELSSHTVDTHLRHIFAKLGCKTRAQAVFLATEQGLLENPIP